MLSNSYQTAERHQEPFAVQFSIFLSNRVGQFKVLLDLLSEAKVQLLGVSIVDAIDWGVVRAVFSDPNRARATLKDRSLPFTESEVLLVELAADETLSEVCGHFLQAEINVHFAYPLTIHPDGQPVMVFHVEDHTLASQMLTKHGFRLLGNEDLADPL